MKLQQLGLDTTVVIVNIQYINHVLYVIFKLLLSSCKKFMFKATETVAKDRAIKSSN